MEPTTERVQSKIFDLDSKDFVQVLKTGQFAPVENANEALARVNHDSVKFLEIVNAGLRDHYRTQLAANAEIPWKVEDEEGNLSDFSGTPISEDKGKQLNVNVLNMAKLLFKYDEADGIADVEEKRKAKRESKRKALDMLLSNPAVVESLKA